MTPADAWQPIESAPRDGTLIVLGRWYGPPRRWERAVGYWFDRDERFPWRFIDPSSDDGINGYRSGPWGPSHWCELALPAPPRDGDG